MIASVGGGFAVLEWWVYLVMALVTGATTWVVAQVVTWQERRAEAPEEHDPEPRRCAGLVHAYNLGRPAYIWCHMPAGHSGPHRDEYGSSEEDYRLRPATQQDGDTMSLFLDRIQRQAYGQD